MKKLSLIIALLFCFAVIFAQNENQEVKKIPKKDYSIFFPETGNIVLGTDGAQWIRFIGSQTFGRINNTGTVNSPISGFQSDLFGKYFLSEKLALRARLNIGFNNNTNRQFVRDDYQFMQNPFSEERTVDVMKSKNGGFELGIGAEIRRSLWRLQGYAGGELFVGYNYSKDNYEYGNQISDANTVPSTHNFGNNMNRYFYDNNYYRVLNTKTTNTINYGGALFVGVDYFFNKNVSLGIEFDLQARAYYTGETKAIAETWRYEQVFTKEITINPTQHGFNLQPVGRLNLMFYF